jgi:WD40 repeat protein
VTERHAAPPVPPPGGRTAVSATRRLIVLGVAVLVLAGIGTGFVLHAASRAADSGAVRAGDPRVTAGTADLDRPRRIAFVTTAPGPYRGRVATVPAGRPGGRRTASALKCARFYAASGTGVCLQTGLGVVSQTNRAVITDAALHTRRTFPLAGIPSRARVSPSGRLAAWTVFVGGESYGAAFFSTRTSIVDTRTWRLLPDLEDFAITLHGRRYHAADINFWGVTFARDDDTFYATLGTGGRTYLVRGSVSARTVTGLGVQNAECPSLSPDGTRIAFKKRILAGASLWHEYVLNLRTLRETPLAERHSVDDQAAWLDDRTLAYALPSRGGVSRTDLWTVPADGTGTARRLMTSAVAPAYLG